MDRRIKVLYISGWGRSGSTVLGNILGQIDGFVHAGELCFLAPRGLVENRLCGCGRPFRDCPFWREVLDRAAAEIGRESLETGLGAIAGRVRTRHIPRAILSRRAPASEDPSRAALAALYSALATVAGAGVIVDSSKQPLYGRLLAGVPSIELHVLHLMRDPRAVAYSWARKKLDPGRGELMVRHGVVRSTLAWSLINRATERFFGRRPGGGYLRVRYEDLVRDPRTVLGAVVEAVGQDPRALAMNDDGSFPISTCHTVSGNPDRFRDGAVRLREDEEWKSSGSRLDNLLVTLLSCTELGRYGYPLRVRRAAGPA